MVQQIINLGSSPNDDTGDKLRTGGSKINANFTELYAAITSEAIKAAYEANPNTNALTDQLLAKLNDLSQYAGVTPVFNATGQPIITGTPVMLSTARDGATDTTHAIPSDASNPDGSIGLVSADIADQEAGEVVMFGLCSGVDTTAWNIGDELWLAAGGGLSDTPPLTGNITSMGYVLKKDASGQILVINHGTDRGIASGDSLDDITGKPALGFTIDPDSQNYPDISTSSDGEPVVYGANGTSANVPLHLKPRGLANLLPDYGPRNPLTSTSNVVNIDVTKMRRFSLNLTEDTTLQVPTGLQDGIMFTIDVTQDAIGGRILSFSYPEYLVDGNIVQPTTINARYRLTFEGVDTNELIVSGIGAVA